MSQKKRTTRIPIPRDVMAEFKTLAGGSKTALAQYLRGYRRSFRRRVAAGETPAQVHKSVKAWRKEQKKWQ